MNKHGNLLKVIEGQSVEQLLRTADGKLVFKFFMSPAFEYL